MQQGPSQRLGLDTAKRLLREYHRLYAGDFEALAAPQVLAGHHVVAAEHVGAGFGEAGAVALIGAAGDLFLLGTHQPVDFVFSRLLAVRAIQRGRLFFRAFIEEFAFVHNQSFVVRPWPSPAQTKVPANFFDYYTFAARRLWQHGDVTKRKKPKPFRAVQAVKAMARERIGAPPASRVVPDRKKKRKSTEKHPPTLRKLLDEA